RLPRFPVPRVLGDLLRHRLQGATRRLVGDPAGRDSQHVPQLGLPAAAADLLRLQVCGVVNETVRIDSYLCGDALDSIADDVRDGLSRDFKELAPKYFYDARGSELFDRITSQPEYYPTRCERAILNRWAPQIVALAEAEELVELGSGTASKTRALLFAMAGSGRLRRYVPMDCSESVVVDCAKELTQAYPNLEAQ